ncbi:MAG: hypothetical protein PHU12_01235, partial [Candidatus Aenigmarchaeota archaeon]|nr:hypothetical protein [Candidatus Aenigmarchaeota archaeon]
MKIDKKLIYFIGFYIIVSALFFAFNEQVIAFDNEVLTYATSFSSPLLDSFFMTITFMGSIVFWLLIVALFWTAGNRKLSTYLLIG